MKSIVIVLFLLSSYTYGQRFHGKSTYDQFKTEDSLEGLYINDNFLKVITDTLPLYTLDESSGWRDMQLVSYFYDSLNTLKKISFRNGRTGYYYFYFEGAYLKKARVIKQDHLINLKYYFTVEDNMCTVSEIERRMTQEPEKKDLYETLKIGKGFFDKFKSLL